MSADFKSYQQEQKARIARLEQENFELRLRPTLQAFADEVGKNIMICLAQTPMKEWPDFAKTAYGWAARGAPAAAIAYKERLPKSE